MQVDSPRQALADFEACLKEKPDSADFLIGRGLARSAAEAVAGGPGRRPPGGGQGGSPIGCSTAWPACPPRPPSRSRPNFGPGVSRPPARRAEPYLDRAPDFLRRAVAALPEGRRAAFWRGQVQVDPMLAPLRGEKLYLLMAQGYGQGKESGNKATRQGT